MKKIMSIMAIAVLIISGIGAIATNNNDTNKIIKTVSSDVIFPTLEIKETNLGYVSAELPDVSTYLMEPGKPMLPKIVKTFELPFEAKDIRVDVSIGNIVRQEITKEISPSAGLLPLTTTSTSTSTGEEKDLVTYSSDSPYPSTRYSYVVRSGLNDKNIRVKHVTVDIYPVQYVPSEGALYVADGSSIKITYDPSNVGTTSTDCKYDMVIIAPAKFTKELNPLVKHKNDVGIKTILKTTEWIYEQYKCKGVDKPEQIKYFIKDAIESWGIKYVLLVGGLKSSIYAPPRDDLNQGSKGWYVPVRYTNLFDNPKFPLGAVQMHDPGVLSDLYYADIYDGEGHFSSWDPNGDGVFAAWNRPGFGNDYGIDMEPDVCLGRLACRSVSEVRTVVDKIITYETTPVKNTDWFNRMTVVSGDGFLDQQDLDIKWDTTGLPNGPYTIYAQSINNTGVAGPVDTIHITIDRAQKTNITFNHDDNLNPALKNGYPAPPIAEIVSVSPDNLLGYDDYTYTPGEGQAYCNGFNPWANISYVKGVLTIRGKSYDPEPYGNLTNIHVWINEGWYGTTIFSDWRNNTEMYYEGEWTTGEKELLGRGGALYYMPDNFERNILWASNGRLKGQDDVINAINEGSGFLFMSGHGSPSVWADHFPGIPGNRKYGEFIGLQVFSLKQRPMLIFKRLTNNEKLPITLVGGCHNSQFNASLLYSLSDPKNQKSSWCWGAIVPDCFSWYLVKLPNGGAIATMGNTGLGYGMPGKQLTTGGGDGWITIEFFKQYGEHYGNEQYTYLGHVYAQTLTSYIQTFDMNDFEAGHPKSVQQWVLLGDPSLKIGGYS